MARSKQSKSDVVSATGFLATLWLELEAAAKAEGVSNDDLHILSTEEGRPLAKPMGQAIARIIADAVNAGRNLFSVIVDYGMTLEQMIAAGRYDWKNGDIKPKHFRISGHGSQEVALELVHYGRGMSSDAVLADLAARGLEPAKIEHLLAFGAKYPDKQREFPIIALGSVWQDLHGGRYVPFLCRHGAGRGLGLFWFGIVWGEHCRFLAVRKSAR